MWKSALVGALTALFVIAAYRTTDCFAPLGLPNCRGETGALTILDGKTDKSPARRAYYLRHGAPAPYRGKRNGFRTTIGNVVEGARLYDLRCAVCHGTMGVGDGEGGETLAHPPADLGASLADPLNADDFSMWTIAEGGAPFDTDMPPFRNDLTETDIWKIVVFMRATFAERTAVGQNKSP